MAPTPRQVASANRRWSAADSPLPIHPPRRASRAQTQWTSIKDAGLAAALSNCELERHQGASVLHRSREFRQKIRAMEDGRAPPEMANTDRSAPLRQIHAPAPDLKHQSVGLGNARTSLEPAASSWRTSLEPAASPYEARIGATTATTTRPAVDGVVPRTAEAVAADGDLNVLLSHRASSRSERVENDRYELARWIQALEERPALEMVLQRLRSERGGRGSRDLGFIRALVFTCLELDPQGEALDTLTEELMRGTDQEAQAARDAFVSAAAVTVHSRRAYEQLIS